MSVRNLSDLKKGTKGKIIRITRRGSAYRRLIDMGLVTGSEVEMQRVAPLGDPIEIKVKGYNLSLRKEEADNIQIEEA